MFICFIITLSSATELLNNKNNLRKSLSTAASHKKHKKEKTSKAISQAKIFINSLGHEVEQQMVVDKAPYKLDRCDQIVAFESDFISDLEDFTKRTKAYFTVTAYHFNRFEGKDINKLDQSILFSNSRVKSTEPQGAQYCLLIDGGDYEKPLLICLKDSEEFENIKTVLSTFEDCRAGRMVGKGSVAANASNNNTASSDPSKGGITEVVKNCGLGQGSMNPDDMIKESKDQKAAQNENSNEDNSYWIPGGHSVPGAPKETTTTNKSS